jgi:hypothetical protein
MVGLDPRTHPEEPAVPRDVRPIVRPLAVLSVAAALIVGACTSPASSAAPTDQMMEHSAAPTDQMMEHSATPSDQMMEHSAAPS